MEFPLFRRVRSIVEGAIIGDFDPGYYKSDRKEKDKEQKIDALHHRDSGDAKSWKRHAGWPHRSRVAETSPAIWSLSDRNDGLIAETSGERAKKMPPKSA